MSKIKVFLACVFVGVAVALTYFVFEAAVRESIHFIWYDLFDTEAKKWLIFPISIVLSLIFFGLRHFLDPKSETNESHGLGEDQAKPSFSKFFTVLLIGYFSLVAGASLGPEAILVPACIIAGGLIGDKLLKEEKQASKIVSAAAIVALFASFFHSFWIGLLTILLVKKVAKAKITPQLVILGVLASGAATLTLRFIEPANSFFALPDYNWTITWVDLLFMALATLAGYASTLGLKFTHDQSRKIHNFVSKKQWWLQGLVTSFGLSILYVLGGPLTMFTGNEAIKPLLAEAPSLGILGVLGIIIIKILATSWSKVMGFRGGLIFPMILVASGLAAIAYLINNDANFIYVLIASVFGILLAEKKAKILF